MAKKSQSDSPPAVTGGLQPEPINAEPQPVEAAEPALDGLDALCDDLTQLDTAASTAYRDLAIHLFAGEQPPTEEIRRVLIHARKSGVDLRVRVQKLRRLQKLDEIRRENTPKPDEKADLNVARAAVLEREEAEDRARQAARALAHGQYTTEINRLNAMAERSSAAQIEIAKVGRELDADIGIAEPLKAAPRQQIPARVLSSDVAGWPTLPANAMNLGG